MRTSFDLPALTLAQLAELAAHDNPGRPNKTASLCRLVAAAHRGLAGPAQHTPEHADPVRQTGGMTTPYVSGSADPVRQTHSPVRAPQAPRSGPDTAPGHPSPTAPTASRPRALPGPALAPLTLAEREALEAVHLPPAFDALAALIAAERQEWVTTSRLYELCAHGAIASHLAAAHIPLAPSLAGLRAALRTLSGLMPDPEGEGRRRLLSRRAGADVAWSIEVWRGGEWCAVAGP